MIKLSFFIKNLLTNKIQYDILYLSKMRGEMRYERI